MKCFGGSDKRRTYHCKIVLLDETELIQEICDTSKGQDLLDIVFKHLNLLETVYFGLRFIGANGQACWLDSTKNIVKQVKNINPLTFYFGVKFYASDPCKLLEEITRYQFFLQIKQDIVQSRLLAPSDLLAQLFAYAVQSELGDYDPRRHQRGYVSEFRFVSNQTPELEKKVAALHKTLVGQVPATAEINFLDKVKWLDLYGADLHPVLGEDNVEYFLGLTPSGVIVLRNKSKVGNYFWPRIVKIFRKDKYFMLQVVEKSNENNTYGFELPSKQACKHLWKCCTEHQEFFRLTQNRDRLNPSNSRFGGFTSRFRYSARSLNKDDRSNHNRDTRPSPVIVRVPSRRYQRRQPDGSEGPTYKEDALTDKPIQSDGQNNVVVPPGRHITQPVIYRSTSVPGALTVNDSPKSIRSAPWENPHQKGLFSSCGDVSPHSTRNSVISGNPHRTSSVVSGQTLTNNNNGNHHRHHHHHRRNSSSSINRGNSKSGRASDNESEISRCSKSSRHSHHSTRSSASHHHRCKSRRNGDESGNESDSSRRRHRRRRKCCSEANFTMVDSEQQWKEIQRRQMEAQESGLQSMGTSSRPVIIQTAHTRDYSQRQDQLITNGYYSQGKENETEIRADETINRMRRKDNVRIGDLIPQEIKKHIQYDLVIPTEEEKHTINYTRVETDNSRLFKIRYSPNSGRAKYKLEKIPVKQNSGSSDAKSTNEEIHGGTSYSSQGSIIPNQYALPRSALKPSNSISSSGYSESQADINGQFDSYYNQNGKLNHYDVNIYNGHQPATNQLINSNLIQHNQPMYRVAGDNNVILPGQIMPNIDSMAQSKIQQFNYQILDEQLNG